MTDKPDVAALVEWLQTWSPVTENGKRAHLAASELTRLADENAELKEFDLTKPDAEWREMYDDQLKRTGFFSGQLSEAKADAKELKRLLDLEMDQHDLARKEIARLTDYNARLHADIAEIGKDNDELEAEIERLTGWFEASKKKAIANAIRCEKAEAEIARLTDKINKVREIISDWDQYPNGHPMLNALGILKSDTGEKP